MLPNGSPGRAPPSHQPTVAGSSGITSEPSGRTPTVSSGAVPPSGKTSRSGRKLGAAGPSRSIAASGTSTGPAGSGPATGSGDSSTDGGTGRGGAGTGSG